MRIFGILIAAVSGLSLLAVTFLLLTTPDAGEIRTIAVPATAANLENGKYLVDNVAACLHCHSQRDYNRSTAPIVPGTEGMGGEAFDQKKGFPGAFYASNITPYGIGEWSDNELFHAITTGISKDGRPLFPIMPYHAYGSLDQSDITDMMAYIRTLKAIENDVKQSEADFPFSLILRTLPEAANLSLKPNREVSVAYGRYLYTMASCGECHDTMQDGQKLAGRSGAGGNAFPLPTGGITYSANITPHIETGIGSWSEDDFLRKFKGYAYSVFNPPKIESNTFNSVMPWTAYGNMDSVDIRAIYKYMQTLPPIENKVTKFVTMEVAGSN